MALFGETDPGSTARKTAMGRPETANQGQLIYEVQQLQRAQAETNRLLTQLLAALTDASTDQPGARHRS